MIFSSVFVENDINTIENRGHSLSSKKSKIILNKGSRSSSVQHDSILVLDVILSLKQKSKQNSSKNLNLITYKGNNDSELEFLGELDRFKSRDIKKDFSIDSSSNSIREESLFQKDFLKVLNSPKSVQLFIKIERKKFYEQINRKQEGIQ